jgi:hypothetical protein
MSKAIICPVCEGSGITQAIGIAQSTPCHGCGGRGWVEVSEECSFTSCTSGSGGSSYSSYARDEITESKPDIVAELEAGLAKAPKRIIRETEHDGNLVTRIFLPAAKWDELTRSVPIKRDKGIDYFHDIPVIRVDDPNFTEIVYCTD